jgi:hypothetical protein
MINLTGRPVVLLLLAAAGGMPSVSAAPMTSQETTTQATQRQATQIQGGVPAPKGRLKFKSSGPVCMCGEGMSERDIEQRMAKLKQKATGSGSVTSSSQATGK